MHFDSGVEVKKQTTLFIHNVGTKHTGTLLGILQWN